MMFGTPDTHRQPTRINRISFWFAVALTIPVIWVILALADLDALGATASALVSDPLGATIALAAFGTAFLIRAWAWTRLLPGLGLGQAWAGLGMTLAGNHLLPLRLGEPLRIVSVVRRTPIGWSEAAASTITLRAADVATIGIFAVVLGTRAIGANHAMTFAVIALALLAVAGGIYWMKQMPDRVRLPGPAVILSVALAWIAESAVVWYAARWAGLELGYTEAVLVTSAAVVAQVIAITPGGFGTYEAGGVAAMAALGYEPSIALAVVLTSHALKAAYSITVGGAGAFIPEPGFFGRLRLPKRRGPRDRQAAPGDGPVVLFMPAHDEAGSVRAVAERVPTTVCGRPVQCIVVDDGSTDMTVSEAVAGGARVVSMESNLGLGAAVRRGITEALDAGASAVAFCDADGEYAPEELERLVKPILTGNADYVVGSRFKGDIRRMLPHRRLGNRILTGILSWIARETISDGQSGYRAFSPETAKAAEVIHDFNYAQVLTLDLLAKGFRYLEVPISYSFRETGTSFVKLGRYLRRVAPAVWQELNTA